MVEGWAAEMEGFGGLELSVEDAVTLDLIGVVVTPVPPGP